MQFTKLLPIFFLHFLAFDARGEHLAGDTAIYAQTFCSNQLVIINNHVYSPFNPTGLEVIPGGAYNGADSIFFVNLTFEMPAERYFNTKICEGDTIFINNSAYHIGHFKDTEVFENAAANGCDSIVYVTVNFETPPFSYVYDTLCDYESIVVNGTVYDRNNSSGLEILPNAAASGCDSLVYISLDFRESWVYLGEDRSLVEGDSICLQVASRFDPKAVSWIPAAPCTDLDCLSFCVDRLTAGVLNYKVLFTDIYGCISSDEVQINISDKHLVFGPNVFSPGLEPPNDRFFLRADRGVVRVVKLVIFDRWGEPVFQQEDISNDESAYDQGWDGTWQGRSLSPGVFGWWAELENFQGRRFTRTGDVSIVK